MGKVDRERLRLRSCWPGRSSNTPSWDRYEAPGAEFDRAAETSAAFVFESGLLRWLSLACLVLKATREILAGELILTALSASQEFHGISGIGQPLAAEDLQFRGAFRLHFLQR